MEECVADGVAAQLVKDSGEVEGGWEDEVVDIDVASMAAERCGVERGFAEEQGRGACAALEDAACGASTAGWRRCRGRVGHMDLYNKEWWTGL